MELIPPNNKTNLSILVTGSTGFIGGLIARSLQGKYNIFGTSRKEVNDANIICCDLTKDLDVIKLSGSISPDVIIHAAGTKDIRFCENNIELATLINTYAVENLAKYFSDTRIIYISTDYVFRGDEGLYTEDDIPNPITIYGKTKYQGEIIGKKIAGRNFKVIRTSSVFSNNSTFINFIRSNLENGIQIEAYSDSIFSPTFSQDLTKCIESIIDNDYYPDIFHINGNAISRYSFAKLFAEVYGFNSGMILSKKRDGRHPYLYNNLSMSNLKTNRILKFKPILLSEAFKKVSTS